MFFGEYSHSIDSKGRVMIPAKFREKLGDEFYIAKGMEGSLMVITKIEFENLNKKIMSLKMIKDKKARAFSRAFYSGISEASLDKQGRALISPKLREYAGLNKDVVIIGLSNKIEIWDKDRWEKYQEIELRDYEDITMDIEDIDF